MAKAKKKSGIQKKVKAAKSVDSVKTETTETKKSRFKFRRKKRAKPVRNGPKISNVYRLIVDSLGVVFSNWKTFGGIFLVYLILLFVLAGSMSSGQSIPDLKDELDSNGESTQNVGAGIALYSVLLGEVGSNPSEGGAAYQTIILIIVSLAIIWALRQLLSQKKVSVRGAFYKGLYPLAPFSLILLVIGLQLIPLIISAVIFNSSTGSSVSTLEIILWLILTGFLALLSIFWISSSIFALYIVTLPDMRPMGALRSARELVRGRRWTVIRKLLFLPLALIILSAFITIPVIFFLAPLAQIVFILVSMMSLFVMHAYIYNLYRELL